MIIRSAGFIVRVVELKDETSVKNPTVLTLNGLCLVNGLITAAVFMVSSFMMSAYIRSNFPGTIYIKVFADWLLFGFLISAVLLLPSLYVVRNWKWSPLWMIIILAITGPMLVISFDAYGLFLVPFLIDLIISAFILEYRGKQKQVGSTHNTIS